MMFNWYRRDASSRLSTILHSFSTPCFLLFIVFNTAFQGRQLLVEILRENNTIQDNIQNLTWFCTLPLSVFTCASFILKREKLWNFFEDWRQMETRFQMNQQNSSKTKKLKQMVVATNWLMYGSVVIAASLLILYRPDASYLLSHYKKVRDSVGLPGVIIFHAVTVFSNFIIESLSGAVPGFIFYHSAQVLRSFKTDAEQIFKKFSYRNTPASSLESSLFQAGMHDICLRYELVSKLVKRANRLFGTMMIFNHGTVLFMIVTLFYSIFYQLKRSRIDSITYFGGMLPYVYQLLIGHLLAAQLHSASKKLRLKFSSLLAKHSIYLTREDVCIASSFLNHLQEDQLAARPLDLYEITSSNFLTFTTLIISYVIVLLQT